MGFLNRYKFWIAMSAVVGAGLALFLFLWRPKLVQNREAMDEIQSIAADIERVARGELRDEEWIVRAEEKKEKLQGQLQELKGGLRNYYADLSAHFDDPETGDEGPIEFFRFRRVYARKMDQLAESMDDKFKESPPSLVRHELRDFKPVEDLHIFEREYWVQKAIIDVVLAQNENETTMRVPAFRELRLERPEDAVMAVPAMKSVHKDEDLFDIWPFSIELVLQFGHLSDLLEAFARSPYGIEVVALDVKRERVVWDEEAPATTRTARDRRRQQDFVDPYIDDWRMRDVEEPEDDEDEEDEKDRIKLPSEMVRVVLRGYVPEYKGFQADMEEE